MCPQSFCTFFWWSHTAIPDPVTRKETIHWFRSELERNRDLTDVVSQGTFFLLSGSCNFVVSNWNQCQDDPTRNTAHLTIILWLNFFMLHLIMEVNADLLTLNPGIAYHSLSPALLTPSFSINWNYDQINFDVHLHTSTQAQWNRHLYFTYHLMRRSLPWVVRVWFSIVHAPYAKDYRVKPAIARDSMFWRVSHIFLTWIQEAYCAAWRNLYNCSNLVVVPRSNFLHR